MSDATQNFLEFWGVFIGIFLLMGLLLAPDIARRFRTPDSSEDLEGYVENEKIVRLRRFTLAWWKIAFIVIALAWMAVGIASWLLRTRGAGAPGATWETIGFFVGVAALLIAITTNTRPSNCFTCGRRFDVKRLKSDDDWHYFMICRSCKQYAIIVEEPPSYAG